MQVYFKKAQSFYLYLHSIALLTVLFITVIVSIVTEPAKMWWMWSIVTCSLCVAQLLFNRFCNAPDFFLHDYVGKFQSFLEIFLWGNMAYIIIGLLILFGLWLDNKDKVPHETIPLLLNQTEAWCYTTCAATNTITSTCGTFNSMMHTDQSDLISNMCRERAEKICAEYAAYNAKICSKLWTDLNNAFENNDVNTEPKYRNIVNFMYGCFLSQAFNIVIACMIKLAEWMYMKNVYEPAVALSNLEVEQEQKLERQELELQNLKRKLEIMEQQKQQEQLKQQDQLKQQEQSKQLGQQTSQQAKKNEFEIPNYEFDVEVIHC